LRTDGDDAGAVIFSIDPEGCQDIDDAMSARVLPNGNIEVGVYIADVTAFVPSGSALDREAQRRATSVYLADRRLDMLPTLLSGNLCSLRSHVDRYVLAVLWQLNPATLNPISSKTWCGRAVIRSKASLTYEQAQDIFDGRKPLSTVLDASSTSRAITTDGVAGSAPVTLDLFRLLSPSVSLLVKISRAWKRSLIDNGAMEFDSTEFRFSLSEGSNNAAPDGIVPHLDLEVHETVAELMIAANSYVAVRTCVQSSFSHFFYGFIMI
jgi:DIS3-like exonuclease 1